MAEVTPSAPELLQEKIMRTTAKAEVTPGAPELLRDPEDLLTRFTLSTSSLFASPLPVVNFVSLTLDPETETYSFAAVFPDDSTVASYCLGAPGSDSTPTPAFIDIPSKNAEGHILLTPILAGTSLIVTEHNGATYRVFHDSRRHASILYQDVVMAIDTDFPTTVLMQFDSSGTWLAYVKQGTTVSVVKPGSYDKSTQMRSVLWGRERLQEQVLQLAADVAVDTTGAEGEYQPGVLAAQNDGTRRWREMREAVRVVNDRAKAPMARAQRELHRRLHQADEQDEQDQDPRIEALYSYLDQWFRANTRKFDAVLEESRAADAIWMWLKEKEAGGVAVGLELDMRRDLTGRITERYAAVEMDCLRRTNTSMAYGFARPGETQFKDHLIESKQRFLQPGVPDKQRGELIRHIGELARQEFEELQRRTVGLTADFQRIGGVVTAVPQDLFFLSNAGDKFGARCFPFVQAMAVAQSTGGFGVDALVGKMFAAVAHPEYADSDLLRQALQNVNGNPGAVRASTVLGRFNIDDVMRRIRPDAPGVVKAYSLNTRTHSMLLAVSTIANDPSWVFYDPNVALVTFPSESDLVIALGMQLLARGFAEIYNAMTSGGGPVFDLYQLDLGALAQVSVGHHLRLTNLTVPRSLTESIHIATSPSLVLPVSEQQKRDVETANAAELVRANNWAYRWRDCVARIKAASNLGPYWVPVLATLRKQPGDIPTAYRIQFINKQNLDETRWVETNEKDIWAFTQFVDGHLEKMRNTLTTEGGSLRPRMGVPDVDAVDGLNSGFMIQALIGWSSGTDDPWGPGTDSPLSTALTIHAYMNMTQMAYSAITDISKTITLVKTMMRSEEAAQASISGFSKTLGRAAGSIGEGIGILFGVLTVGLDITEMALAEDSIELSVFGTQLVFDCASLVVGVGSVGAGLVGAAGASAVLGGAAVILSGLAVGFGALAEAFGEVARDAQKVGIYFDLVDKAYNNGGYTFDTEHGGILRPIPYAVIKKVDLSNGRVDFDSQYIYRTKHGHTGSGESNYIGWIGDAPVMVVDRVQAINIREGIGKADHSLAVNRDGYAAVVLPCTPKSYIQYQWQILPGATTRNDTGFEIIRRLEKDYRFDYDFYIFPIEKIIRSITQEYVATPVTIVLPSHAIRLEVPELPQEMHNHMSYTLEGNGGVYTVGLHKGSSVTLSVAPGGLRSIQWVLDMQNLGTTAVATIVAGGLLIGGVTVSIDQYGGEFRILILGAHGLLSEVNFIDNSISPISEDAAQFTGRPELMSNLAQHLHDLSTAHQLHSEFVVVNHYEVPVVASAGATEKVGRAFFDVQWDRFFYTRPTAASLSVVTDAELAAIIGDDVYFYNTNTASLWRVKKPHPGSTAWDHGDRGCLAEYCPLFPNKHLRLRHVWHESDIIYATYSLERESASLGQLIYAIQRDRMCLVTIVGYTSMIHGLAEMQHLDQDTLLSLMAVMYNDTPELPDSLGGTLIRAQHDAELITVYGPDEFGVFHRFWLRKKDNAVIRAILHNNPIPEDLVFPGSLISAETGTEVFFFYFKDHPDIYRQTGPGAGSAEAVACQVPAAFGTLNNLFNADGELFVSTSYGYILRLTAAGMFFLEGITRVWFEKHSTPLWTYALAQVAEEATATTLTVLGVQDGDAHIPVWYHHGRTVIVSAALRGKRLQPLGLDGSGGAWVCDWETPQSGQLYLQPLIRNDDLHELFEENGWTCCEPDRIPVAEPVLGDHRVRSFAVVKDGLQITTVDGIVFILGEGGSINLVAVNEDWQLAHRDNLVSSMSLLLETWLHSEVVIFHGTPTAIAAWYHVARQEVLHIDPITWAANPVWLGITPTPGVGLVSLQSSGDMYRTSVRGGTRIGSYTLTTRCDKTLVLSHPREHEVNFPLLVGADAILLTAEIAKMTYVISERVWAKYRTITIDNPGEQDAPVVVKFTVPGVAAFMASNVDGDLVLLDMGNGNTLTVKGALGDKVEYNGILIDTGVGLVGTGEIRDAQNMTANFLGVTAAPDITLAYVMSKQYM